jgi:hypothetical protein
MISEIVFFSFRLGILFGKLFIYYLDIISEMCGFDRFHVLLWPLEIWSSEALVIHFVACFFLVKVHGRKLGSQKVAI